MPTRLNTLLEVEAKKLDEKGVFNGFIDLDSNFHIDPSLLKTIDIPEFENSHSKFTSYFEKVLKIVGNSSKKGDRFWRAGLKLLQFKENPYISLGYSKDGNHGSAIGTKLAETLTTTTKDIISVGINDPTIFELIGVFEKGIGADRVSDMTISIIFNDLVKYTIRVARELEIETVDFKNKNKVVFPLPKNKRNGKPIIFVPKKLLRDLPVAYCWEDIDRVVTYNDSLRRKVNKTIGNTWKKATSSKVPKGVLKSQILQNPELIKDLINQYNRKPKTSYDFNSDPQGEFVWYELAEKALNEHPLELNQYKPITSENILEVVKQICNRLKQLIENNGWFEFLYSNQGKLRNERFPQKLFYGIAELYCQVNNLDISREPNAGSGALDFKLSRGYSAKVAIEIKYSSNPNLVKGFTTQLPIYNKAEKSEYSVYLVIRTTKTDSSIRKLKAEIRKQEKLENRVPLVFFIDGRVKLSASRRK